MTTNHKLAWNDEIYYLTVLKVWSPKWTSWIKSYCGQGCIPSGGSGEETVFSPHSDSGGCPHSLAHDTFIYLQSQKHSIFQSPSDSDANSFSSYTNPSDDFRPNYIIQDNYPSSHVLGIMTSTSLGDIILLSTNANLKWPERKKVQGMRGAPSWCNRPDSCGPQKTTPHPSGMILRLSG